MGPDVSFGQRHRPVTTVAILRFLDSGIMFKIAKRGICTPVAQNPTIRAIEQPMRMRQAMAWETRGKRRYFYTAERFDGRVVKTYWPGESGEAMARHVDQLGSERSERQKSDRNQQQRRRQIDEFLDEFSELTRVALQAVAFLNGFHFHRGEWRQRRDNSGQTDDSSKASDNHPSHHSV